MVKQVLSRLQKLASISITTSLKMAQDRLVMLIGLILLLTFIVVWRLVSLMVLGDSQDSKSSRKSSYMGVVRADIVDRNGEVLATNLKTGSLYAKANQLLDAEEAAKKLSKLFPDLSYESLYKKFQSQKSFVWIKRNLTPKQQAAVYQLGIPGIYFQQEERRVYPHGSLTSHLLGLTDIDQNGISGLEKAFDHLLKQEKNPLQISLDIRIQHVMHEELQKAIQKFHAIRGNGVLISVETGEILAMVSLPDFDPNKPIPANSDVTFNSNTLGVYEMGSIFKTFAFAMSLDSGKVTIKDSFDATKPLRIGRFSITDHRGKNRVLTVPEMFMYSSNIATGKMVMEIGPAYQKMFMKKLGFFEPVKIELPETGRPLLPGRWENTEMITISYGYGLAVTPLHVVRAIAAMVNGGVLKNLSLVPNAAPDEGVRVIQEKTSELMRRLLYLGAQKGTARKANAPGYLVGGKTGSANKKIQGGYQKKDHLASVVAAFPMINPKYVLLVTLDSPKPTKDTFGYATGGWTAAPVAKEVIFRMAPLLGIMPVDEQTPEIQSVLYLPTPGE